MWSAVAGAALGGVAGYRVGRGVGGLVGAVAGGLALPRVVDAFGGMTSTSSSSGAAATASTSDDVHIGKAVVRPSTADAIALLRPTLALYGSRELASAALANAYAESRFDVKAGGDVDSSGTPQAIGLFQLHSSGAGRGMTIADRSDPMRATRRILDEAAARGLPGAAPASAGGGWWDAFVDALDGEDAAPVADPISLAALTSRWTVEVERPANSGVRAVERVTSLRTDNYLRNVLTGLGLPVI